MPDCGDHSETKIRGNLQDVWRGPDGTPLSCREKIRLLEEGLTEFQAMAQDLMEDALLMGVDEDQIKEALVIAAHTVNNPYTGRLEQKTQTEHEG